MNKNTILSTVILIFALLGFSLPASAHYCTSPNNFYYRSTIMGTGINHVHTYVYDIKNPTNQFNTSERVYALTRIFNIEHINNFRIKHEVYRHGENKIYKEAYSTNYNPKRRWWAETWAYNDLGTLPAGDYEMRALINVDGRGYKNFDSKNFTVRDPNRNYSYNYDNCYNYDSSYNYDCDNRDYNYRYDYADYRYDNRNYYQSPSYSFSWTYTGTGVREMGGWQYEISGQKTGFNTNEDVYVLTKISNIKAVDRFRVKHDLYVNGSYKSSNEGPVQQPKYNYWTDNYTWNNFGKQPSGNHEIRTYISVNGGGYTHLKTTSFSVTGYGCWDRWDSRCSNYDRDYDHNYNYNYGNYDCRNNPGSCYRYDWSYMDNRVENTSGSDYRIVNPKTSFNTNESVVVLTKVSNIRGIDYFQIRHELYYSNGSLIKTNSSDTRYPRYNNWDYNYYWSDFGRLSSGDYNIKVYISVNGGSYNYLDTKSITVRDSGYNANYTYDWTRTGTNINQSTNYFQGYYDYGYYEPTYYNYN